MPSQYQRGTNADRSVSRSGGRHRAPSQPSSAGRVLRTTGAIVAIAGTGIAASAVPAGAATADDFAKLRQCESGGNYSINTGNGFYGAYQFDLRTWQGLGYSGKPSDAPPAMQDDAAHKLYNARGWSPWPSCSVKMGLTNDGPAPAGSDAGSGSGSTSPAAPAEPEMTLNRAQQQLGGDAFSGTVLSTQYAGDVRADAYVWQNAMRQRKFVLTVDGKFGPQSQRLAAFYSYLTGVTDGQSGVVGKNLWQVTVS
jgi:resuscitation-promoting factor RpfA